MNKIRAHTVVEESVTATINEQVDVIGFAHPSLGIIESSATQRNDEKHFLIIQKCDLILNGLNWICKDDFSGIR